MVSTENYEDLVAKLRESEDRYYEDGFPYGNEAADAIGALVKERDQAIRTYKALDGVLAKTQRELNETQADLRKAQFRANSKAQEWRDALSVIEQVRAIADEASADIPYDAGNATANRIGESLRAILSSFSVGAATPELFPGTRASLNALIVRMETNQ